VDRLTALLPTRWLRELAPLSVGGVRVARGEGVLVWDDEQRRYLDLASGWDAPLGHAHPALLAAITEQAGRLSGAHPGFEFDARDDLIEALSLVVPEPLSHVSVATTSAAARRRAVRCARLATGRSRIVVAGVRLTDPMSERVTYGELGAAERAVDTRVAAVVVPAVDAADVRVPVAGYLAELALRCRRTGALLVIDEERTALCTGSTLACTAAGVMPDILTMGGGLAAGLPFGVMITRPEVARRMQSMPGASGAGPVVCAAAAATLRIAADPAFRSHIDVVAEHLLARLRSLRLVEIREVRGCGLLLAIDLRHRAHATVMQLRERGVLVASNRADGLRVRPPLTLEKRQADAFVEALASAVLALRRRGSASGSARDVELRGAAARRSGLRSRPE